MRAHDNAGRGSRRGPRRQNPQQQRGRSSSVRHSTPPPRPVKQNLWQKILAFFSGGGKPYGKASALAKNRDQSRAFNRTGNADGSSRRPETVEVSSPKLYVGNLSFDAVETDLFDLFNGVGQVQNAEIVSHKYTEKSKGFAFITMQTIAEAKRAVTELHDKEFMGRKLVVSGAKTSDVRDVR